MVRVLVVEDEANIREMIALNLRLAGMEAVEAESAEAALPLLEKKPGCDAAILDVMLPGMNGFSLCETIRRTDQKIGIIILSAKGQEQDKIRGLSIGADDYMTKPFSVSELLARVKALCRRVGRTAGGDEKEKENPLGMLTSSEFVLDVDTVIMALGTSPNPLIRSTTPGLETNKHGCIVTEGDEGKTSREGVYAGGDAVTGAATVIKAMGAGKAAAKAMDEYIQNK